MKLIPSKRETEAHTKVRKIVCSMEHPGNQNADCNALGMQRHTVAVEAQRE
ncbi:hypothetical protein LEMLEM_LOCUS20838 [Lemmus lemmus]